MPSSSSSSFSPLERIVFIQRIIKFSAPEPASCVRYATVTSSWFDCFSNYGTPIFENLIKLPSTFKTKRVELEISDDDEEDLWGTGGNLMVIRRRPGWGEDEDGDEDDETAQEEKKEIRRDQEENDTRTWKPSVKTITATVQVKMKSWQECLSIACTHGMEWVVDQLLPAAARFLTSTMLKEVSLGFVSCAVASCQVNIVRKLIDFGAIVESERHNRFFKNNYGNAFGSIHEIRKQMHLHMLNQQKLESSESPYQLMYDSDEDEFSYTSPPGEVTFSLDEMFSHQFLPPIVVAFEKGNVEIVKLLLAKGASLETVVQFFFDTLIIICCRNGHVELLKWLMSTIDDKLDDGSPNPALDANRTERLSQSDFSGASRNAIDFLAINSSGESPLSRPIQDQNRAVQCAEYLIRQVGAVVNPHHVEPCSRCSALHFACGAWRFDARSDTEREAHRLFYRRPGNYSNYHIKQDFKQDFDSLSTCNLPLIKFLIESCQVDPNAIDANGYPPIAYAIANLDVETVKYFLSLDEVRIGNNNNENSLEYGQDEWISAIHFISLALFNVDDNDDDDEEQHQKKNSILSKAREIVKLLLSERSECSTEKARKDFCTIEDPVGNLISRPLYGCVINRNALMAELLILEFDADWEAETVRGTDVLTAAAAVAGGDDDENSLFSRVNSAIERKIEANRRNEKIFIH